MSTAAEYTPLMSDIFAKPQQFVVYRHSKRKHDPQVGDIVQIVQSDSTEEKAREKYSQFWNKHGRITDVPVHPNTWYRVEVVGAAGSKKTLSLRRPNLQLVDVVQAPVQSFDDLSSENSYVPSPMMQPSPMKRSRIDSMSTAYNDMDEDRDDDDDDDDDDDENTHIHSQAEHARYLRLAQTFSVNDVAKMIWDMRNDLGYNSK